MLGRSAIAAPPDGLGYSETRVSCTERGGTPAWRVNVDATLSAGGAASGGPLLLVVEHSPLVVDSVRCERAKSIARVVNSDGRRALLLEPFSRIERPWHGATLRFELLWHPGDAGDLAYGGTAPRGVIQCLSLPDMLPPLLSATDPLVPPLPTLPRVFLEQELPERLDAGGLSIPDRHGALTPTLLQTVIFPRAWCVASSEKISVVDAIHVSKAGAATALRRATQMTSFLEETLEFDPPAHIVVHLEADHEDAPVLGSGAYCPVTPLAIGAIDPKVGQDLSVIRALAQVWINGGVRIAGENAGTLMLGLAGALGVLWFEANGRDEHATATVQRLRTAVERAEATGHWERADQANDLMLEISGSPGRLKLLQSFGRLISQRWGSILPQSLIVELLRKHRVAVRHVFE